MTKWRARTVVALLGMVAVWPLVLGGWWLVLLVPIAAALAVVEMRWSERWPWRSSS